MAKLKSVPAAALETIREFLALESAGGLLLVGAAALGMVFANSPLRGLYDQLLALPLTVKLGGLGVDKPLLLWINDGLMAVFFLLVALELKREMLEGQFSDRRQITLPAACALGGMLVPMAIYGLLNRGDATAMAGLAIPAATDIAFALGILALLGERVPIALKLLLMAIAVLDDLGAIVIIAVFYTAKLAAPALLAAAIALAVLIVLNRAGVAKLTPYLLVGAVLWLAVLKSGVHATLAGVALGFLIPLTDRRQPGRSPLRSLEHDLHPAVAYAILPIFAFANAGVSLAGLSLATLAEPVPAGIALGLLLGKPLGIGLLGGLCVLLGLARLPAGVGRGAFLAMGVLCGIGFTMSLFIGSLAFENATPELMVQNRLGILAGSLVAALVGFGLLRWQLRGPRVEAAGG